MFIISSKTKITNALTKFLFSFSRKESSVLKFRKRLDEEVIEEVKNIEHLTKFQKYFEKLGWTITYNDCLIQIQKYRQPYEVQVVCQTQTPQLLKEKKYYNQQQQHTQSQQQTSTQHHDQFCVKVCLREKGNRKWLIADYWVKNYQLKLSNIIFVQDELKEKVCRFYHIQKQFNLYKGSNLNLIQDRIPQMIEAIVESLGLKVGFFHEVYQFSMAYEQKFYLEWLTDMKNITQ